MVLAMATEQSGEDKAARLQVGIIACSIRPGRPGLHARDMPVEEAGQ